MPSLDDVAVTDLKGVGSKLAVTLAKLDLFSVQDLLFHLPFRYEDRTRVLSLLSLRTGQHGLFEGSVDYSKVVLGRRRSLEVAISDGSGTAVLRFYHFSTAQMRLLEPGVRLRGYGEARLGRTGLEFYHPEYTLIQSGQPLELPETLTPVYTLTDGILQARMRALIQQALDWLDCASVPDLLPERIRQRYRLPDLVSSLRFLHQPPLQADQQALLAGRHVCQKRLILEELTAHHLSLLQLRQRIRADRALACPQDSGPSSLDLRLLDRLPFRLTSAQRRVVDEIRQDMAQPVPMLRLVQGDVGSGKTIVAALAAVAAVQAGAQVALMAPTEILAEQHLRSFDQWLSPLGIHLGWLSGRSKGGKRAEVLGEIVSGTAQVVIGTHALFQDDVRFARLGLVIIDEQHRFGVHQRLALKEKAVEGLAPHQLVMTATPIPRTLAMSAYADLDTSVIDELPPGRQQIETVVIPDTRRDEIVERIRIACAQGRQAYWVCTLIEESETLQCQAAEATATWLQEALPERVVALVHGRMKAAEKTAVMEAFKTGKADLLVATTVIEVGVDVPNASLIIIENPERLGLAQLHQLRGRVGRGSQKSYCTLLYHPPLSLNGKARLQVLRDSNDGFVIAEKDLEIRGPGEVLGTRQTGLVSFRLADLQRDREYLGEVKAIARELIADDCLTEALIQRWLGQRRRYGEV
jgi:ATP-dependent DNA helicase RecG